MWTDEHFDDDLQVFFADSTRRFLHRPESSRAQFRFATGRGCLHIYLEDQSKFVTDYFHNIFNTDLPRFRRLNCAFQKAQPLLAASGLGWVVTRFAGDEHLSLRMGDELYVRRIPKHVGQAAVAKARAENRFLDCSVTLDCSANDDGIPLELAMALAG